MSVREYIGSRYIPLFPDDPQWSSSNTYEPLTVVQYQGSSYVSRQYVPVGIQISNTDYWVLWADFNSQIEQYRREVQAFDGRITANTDDIEALEDIIPKESFDSVNTVAAAIDANAADIDALEDIIPKTAFDNVNTVAAAIDAVSGNVENLSSTVENIQTAITNIPIVTPEMLAASDLETAYVIGVSNSYTSNYNGLYKKVESIFSNDSDRFCLPNGKGDYLEPVRTEQNAGTVGNAMPSILNAMSYLGRSNVTYTGDNQIFDPELAGNANGMVCSDYTMLYLMGTGYDDSAFNGQPNLRTKYHAAIPKDTRSVVGDEVIKLGWNTREQMYAAFVNGDYAYTKNPTVSMMQPGDVLYSCDWSEPQAYEYMWGAQHCAIVVNTEPETEFYTVLEVTEYVGTTNHQYCLTAQGGTHPNSAVMTYKSAKNLDGLMLFRPSFNPLLKIENILHKENAFQIVITDTLTRQYNIDPDGGATIPKNSLVVFKFKTAELKNLFTNNPSLNRLNVGIRGKDSETAMNSAKWDIRRFIYRDSIVDPNKHLPEEMTFVGYTITDVVQFGVYFYTEGQGSEGSLTWSDYSYTLDCYALP